MPKLPKFLVIKEDDTEEEKKKKRFLLILFIILFFLVAVGIILGIVFGVRSCSKPKEGSGSTSQPTVTSGTSEPVVIDYLNYALNDDGVSYKVTGIKSGHPADLVIPDTHDGKPVTAIGNFAFEYNKNLKTVVMTDNITHLGTLCFYKCEKLESVDLSENLVSTDTSCFIDCTALKTITLPDTLVDAETDIFVGCTALETVEYDNANYIGNSGNPYMFLVNTQIKTMTSCEVKDGCRYIAAEAFKDCTSLTTITIPQTVTKLGVESFENAGLSTVNLPSNLKKISYGAFKECHNLTSIIIPDSVVELESSNFADCENLTNVQFGKGLTCIDSSLFDRCASLSSVSIPTSITLIDMFAFAHCSSLTELDYEGTTEEWGQIGLWDDWASYSAITVVHCSNGDVPIVIE